MDYRFKFIGRSILFIIYLYSMSRQGIVKILYRSLDNLEFFQCELISHWFVLILDDDKAVAKIC